MFFFNSLRNVLFSCFVPLEFDCSDGAFGVGNVGENKTGDCNGDMSGYRIARCNESGDWIVTYDSCILSAIKYLKDRSQVT